MRKKISRIKRGLAVMLSVCMVFGVAPIQAGAEENDSEIAVQTNDSAGKTEQQSTEEEECKHEGVEITSTAMVSETARNAMQPYISLLLKQLTNMTLTMTA